MKTSVSSPMQQETAAAASSRLDRTQARRWTVLELTGVMVALSLLFGARHAVAQGSLPVYPVQQNGADAVQAAQLTSNLGVPSGYSLINGEVSFIDPTNFMVVPSIAVTDSTVVSNLTAGTVNQYPGIPLSIREINLTSLSNVLVMSTSTALNRMATALSVAGLAPQTPVTFSTDAGHTTCTLAYTNPGGGVVSNSQSLDTRVTYQFTLGGYPLVGPGAQVQVTFPGGQGTTAPTNAAQVVYSARRLGSPEQSVTVFSAIEAANRVAALYYPGLNAQITPQLIYYCPALSIGPTVSTIIPHYHCTASITVDTNTMDLMPVLIPATDDPQYVPVPQLTAQTDPQSGQVVANVIASGGLPPYTYVWGGSDAKASTNTGASVTYTPLVRVTPPSLGISIRESPTLAMVLAWPDDPTTPFVLESATQLTPPNWSDDTHPIILNTEGFDTVTIENFRESPPTFFRLRLATTTLAVTETVTVTVMDANGVTVPASFTLPVQAVPIPVGAPDPPITYGCESPYDAGLGTADRVSWQAGMGTVGAGGGVQRFCWTGQLAWPGDFIEPPIPGMLPWPLNPAIFGDADFANWGVNTADIVFYVGHGAPWGISTTYPCFPTANPGSVVWDPRITVGAGGPAVTTHWGGNCGAQANFNVPNYPLSWRTGAQWPNDTLEWLCLLSCEVLQANWPGAAGPTAWQRWGPAFNGLHFVTGFRTIAWAGTGFPQVFVNNMLGVGRQPMPIVSAWFAAAQAREWRWDAVNGNTGRAAATGPLKWLWVTTPPAHWALFSDISDFYWGKGPVGPNLYPPFAGGWYVSQP